MRRNRGLDQVNSLFLATYSTIQFWDVILWFNQAEKGLYRCTMTNRIVTSFFIPITLWCELYMSAKYSLFKLPDWWKPCMYLCGAWILFRYFGHCTVLNSTGHGLLWGNVRITFVEYIIFYILLMRPQSNATNWIQWFISTWWVFAATTFLFFYTVSFGSYWCFYAAALSFLYIIT